MNRLDPAWSSRLGELLTNSVAALDVTSVVFADDPPDRISVERGMAWPALIDTPSGPAFKWLEPLLKEESDLEVTDVVDGVGHGRAAYAGLLMYAVLQALRASDWVLLDSPAAAVVRQMDGLRAAVATQVMRMNAGAIPAAQGDRAALLAWQSLALLTGGELLHDDRLVGVAQQGVQAIVSRQQAGGGYLLPSMNDNPETMWLHELQTLHAVASFGLQTDHATTVASAVRAAAWHMNETQPDHATHQPWGLSAFLIDPQTHIMVDALLHAAAVQQPERMSAVTLILIADALYSWRRR